MSIDHYILVGREAVPFDVGNADPDDPTLMFNRSRLIEWAQRMEVDRRVAVTEVGAVTVSTVFLGLDHQWIPGGPPLIFETMTFVSGEAVDQWRYSTWAEAETGHMEIVEQVQHMDEVTQATVREVIERIRHKE